MERAERTYRNQFKSHQVRLTERELLKHFVCFISGVEVQEEDDSFVILTDIPLINLPREVKLHRSGYLSRHDCLALLGREWCYDRADREDFCRRNGRKRAWCGCCLHQQMLRNPLDLGKRSFCVMEPPLSFYCELLTPD